MLSLFNKYLARMRLDSPIFGNKNIFMLILDYLEGEDLYHCQCVCFAWKETIISNPILEVRLLRFTMSKSNAAIENLRRQVIEQPKSRNDNNFNFSSDRFSMIPKFLPKPNVSAKNIPKEKTLKNDEKLNEWNDFINYFYVYAKDKGFLIKKKRDFKREDDFREYEKQFSEVYKEYANHVNEARRREKLEMKKMPIKNECRFKLFKQNSLKDIISSKYRDIMFGLGTSFHIMTDFKYFHVPSSKPAEMPKLKKVEIGMEHVL
ncbi:unnamed protein product [Blepharisma stoltei]|uniref:F-box domain-containing protein n=1 Tax=Blepharisma stoltei TaxID=1481888 RepID=A0AAU9J515_9CILI|nr:unnamed protein product [Blepharisma stoltei]